jgi:hypothetical protein
MARCHEVVVTLRSPYGRRIHVPRETAAIMRMRGECLSAEEERRHIASRDRVTWHPRLSAGYIVMQMDS